MMMLTRQYQNKTRTKQRKSAGNRPQWTTMGKTASYHPRHEKAPGLYNLFFRGCFDERPGAA
jgi:hypothetical protein